MAHPRDTAAVDGGLGLSEEQVAAYLRRHPDFLVRRPDLVHVLTPPSRVDGDGVVDMQTFMIERLRGEIDRLRDQRDAVVMSSRHHLSKQNQVHAAVIAMLGAQTLEHLIDVVTGDFLPLLDVDVAALCVENDASRRRCTRAGVHCLAPGTIDALLAPDQDVVVRDATTGDERVFGAGAGLVRAAILLRLRLGGGAPPCLLALGSRHEGRFRPGQGAELFAFLARALEHCLRGWLNLAG